MKSVRMQAVKRDVSMMKRGLRNAVRALTSWISSSKDRETTKKRLLITLSVPAGFIFVGSAIPSVAIAAAIILLLGTVFWFARVQERYLIVQDLDAAGPFRFQGRLLDFEGLLGVLAATYPDADLETLGDHLHDLGGPSLSERQMAAQLRFYRVRHQSVPVPSPTAGPGASLPEKAADQEPAEGSSPPEAAEQGRGKAWIAVTGLVNQARRYAGSSVNERKNHAPAAEGKEEPGEQGAVGLHEERGPGGLEAGAPHEGGAPGGTLVRDAGDGGPGPGRVPDPGIGQGAATDEKVAEEAR